MYTTHYVYRPTTYDPEPARLVSSKYDLVPQLKSEADFVPHLRELDRKLEALERYAAEVKRAGRKPSEDIKAKKMRLELVVMIGEMESAAHALLP